MASRNSPVVTVGSLFSRYSFFLLLGLAIFLLPAHSIAQRQGKAPAIGDIIEYSGVGPEGVGMVLNFGPGGSTMIVEAKDPTGKFREITVITSAPGFRWKLLDSAQSAAGSAERIWVSSDGKFEIKAKMIEVVEDKVKLEKPDGGIVTVPVGKLGSKDQAFVRKYKGSLVSTSDAGLSNDVLVLKERRDELMKSIERHQRLAKLGSNLMVGDIIQYDDFFDGTTFGIVTGLGTFGTIEKVKNGELESSQMTHSMKWTFFDREFVAVPLEVRTWKSAQGSFSVKARMLSIDGDNLVLEKNGGESLRVPLAKLSKSDQSYVKRVKGKIESKNDEALAAERLDYGPDLQMLLERRSELVQRESANMIAAKAVSKMKSISLNTRSVDLAAERLKPFMVDNDSISITVPVRVAEDARLHSVSFSREANVVAFTAFNTFKGVPTLGVIDLNTSESVTNIDSDKVGRKGKVVAISPSGETLILFSGEPRSRQLELWKYKENRLNRKSIISYDSFHDPKAHLFSDTQGVILSSDGKLVFFDAGERIIPTHHISAGRMAGENDFEVTNDQKSIVYFDCRDTGNLHYRC